MFKKLSLITICFLITASSVKGQEGLQIDKTKFQNIYRSGKAVEGGTSVGINYDRFSELLQNFATEISIVSDTVKEKQDGELLAIYLEALGIYKDSATLWNEQISDEQYDYIPSGAIFLGNVGHEGGDFEVIADKYNLSKQVNSQAGGFETISGDSIQILWDLVGKKLEEANAILNK